MRWVVVAAADGRKCRISDAMTAWVYPYMGGWLAEVCSSDDAPLIWQQVNFESEEAAKAAVCHWIGKTMAQFSNALAAGCNAVDDGA